MKARLRMVIPALAAFGLAYGAWAQDQEEPASPPPPHSQPPRVTTLPMMPRPMASIYPGGMPCTQQDMATITVTLNGSETDASAIKSRIDGRFEEIKSLAKGMHFDKFVMQSVNYHIRTMGNPGGGEEEDGGKQLYHYNGMATFSVLPSDRATDFLVALTKKGYRANLDVNNFRQGNCE